jgi:hypothetical protein
MLSSNVVRAYWDELEKIANLKSGLIAGVGAGLLGTAAGLGGTALYLHGNAQQDRLLRDLGVLNPEEAKHRQMKRVAAMVGVASAMGIGGAALGGIGGGLAMQYAGDALANTTRGMWETAGKNLQNAIDQGLDKQVKSGDKLLAKQMEYGRDMVVSTSPEVARSMGREFLGGVGESLPLVGRFFRKKTQTALKTGG